LDLVEHLGGVHRFWAATALAGPADAPPTREPDVAPREREALLAWSAESTRQLLDALRGTGPDLGCWTWWGTSQAPQITGRVARHQVQEATVHTYDAQLAAGAAHRLPTEAALDGVDEFLVTCCATTAPWKHEPAYLDFHATEGRSWRVALSADGVRVSDPAEPGSAAEALPAVSIEGPADQIVLLFYGRIPLDDLAVSGDRAVFEQFSEWDPDA
jgi:uncharacterized protein (TIGR03083 family)